MQKWTECVLDTPKMLASTPLQPPRGRRHGQKSKMLASFQHAPTTTHTTTTTRGRRYCRDMRLKRFLDRYYDVRMRVLMFIYTRPCEMNDRYDGESHLGCTFCKLSGTFMVRLYVQEFPRYEEGYMSDGWWEESPSPVKETHPSYWKSEDMESHFFCSLWCHSTWVDLGNRRPMLRSIEMGRIYNYWRSIALYKELVLGIEPRMDDTFEMW